MYTLQVQLSAARGAWAGVRLLRWIVALLAASVGPRYVGLCGGLVLFLLALWWTAPLDEWHKFPEVSASDLELVQVLRGRWKKAIEEQRKGSCGVVRFAVSALGLGYGAFKRALGCMFCC